jgi:hypothetical protein
MRESRLFGSEGGANLSFVPTLSTGNLFPERLPVSEWAKKVRKYRKVPKMEVKEVKFAKSSKKNLRLV